MSDDNSGGGRSDEATDPRLHTGNRDLPVSPTRGLFRQPSPSRATGFEEGDARLRLVTGSGNQRLSGSARPRLSADMWEDLRRVSPGMLAGSVLDLDNLEGKPVPESFDRLRTQLLQQLRSNGWNRIAVASPTQGCGASFSAANLALSFARVPGNRTVLLDLNMRRPAISDMLDMHGIGDMHGFLNGRVHLRDHLVCISETLAVGLTPAPDTRAAHLLHSDCGAVVVNDLVDRLCPEVLICDLPPILENDDLIGFLPQVDGVLLVADAMQTLPDHISACEDRLNGLTRVMGVVLNQTQNAGPAPTYA